jgi:hypothetical protein
MIMMTINLVKRVKQNASLMQSFCRIEKERDLYDKMLSKILLRNWEARATSSQQIASSCQFHCFWVD